jgi:hypothetical protein
MSARTDLENLRKLLARPHGWCQGHYCRPSIRDDGRAYCLVGGVQLIAQTSTALTEVDILEKLRVAAGVGVETWSAVGFNDNHTKAQVLALIDKAIKNTATEEGVKT